MVKVPPRYVFAAFLLAAVGCSGKFGYRLEERVQGEIPLPHGVRGIRVELSDGDVTFVAGEAGLVAFFGVALKAADSPAQLALLESVGMGLTAALENGVMRLEGPSLPAGAVQDECRLALRLTVSVPPSVPLEVVARAGNLAAIDLSAPVRLTTRHGMLHPKNLHGPGTLRTGNGDVIVDDHWGGLDVETDSGKLFAWVQGLDPTGVRLISADGPIQARLPQDASFQLDAEVAMGKAANEYGVPVLRKGEFGATMKGRVGEGGPPVVLRTGQGHISLRRLTEAGESPLQIIVLGLLAVVLLVVGLILYRTRKLKTANA